jgi:hypothetical protein
LDIRHGGADHLGHAHRGDPTDEVGDVEPGAQLGLLAYDAVNAAGRRAVER